MKAGLSTHAFALGSFGVLIFNTPAGVLRELVTTRRFFDVIFGVADGFEDTIFFFGFDPPIPWWTHVDGLMKLTP